jgi:hypothetical protein
LHSTFRLTGPHCDVPRRDPQYPLNVDIVEKLEFPRRSQFRRPLPVSMEISLGAQRSDRSFCVRPSLRPCCGNYSWRQHYARGSRIFVAPQFPTFSTISVDSSRLECANSARFPKASRMGQPDVAVIPRSVRRVRCALKWVTARGKIPGDPCDKLVFTPMWTKRRTSWAKPADSPRLWQSTSSATPA